MKFDYGYSVCISTQVGCNMGCKFCASGLLKKIRNLSTDEMVLQILGVNEYLQRNSGAKVSNVVVMGIGEPFDNYENLSNALKIIKENHAIGIGSRHITVSTCGVAPKIIEFGNDFNQINLAISLHAPNNEIRDKIMPVNKAYPLQVLFNALRKYSSTVNRKITFEYLLLGGVNDSVQNAVELSKLVKEFECYVNLIIYNSVDEHSFKRSANSKSFAETLIHNGVKVTTRLERGSRISAACGQLRANHEKNK
jgi:23S rRNA (adenine2503-C2)-methyltransferase